MALMVSAASGNRGHVHPTRMGHETPDAMNSGPIRTASRLLVPVVVALFASPLLGQSVPGVSIDTTDLGTGPAARMHMLLERTIFQVDVLTLDIRLGSAATDRIERLLAGSLDAAALSDSVAAAALAADDALVRLEFQRGVGLEQFLDGIRDNLRLATRAGIVTPADFRSISSDLPGWYAFLNERGIRSGDRMLQRVRGDTLRTVYEGADGEVLLDQVDVGTERRLAVLGGYFAPGSAFREGLVESLLAAHGDD